MQAQIMTTAELISAAIEIGQQLLESGAELYRVEESMQRICLAYGARDTHVYAVPTSIIITIAREGEAPLTRSRRIYARGTDLSRIDSLNMLCRRLCAEPQPYDVVRERLAQLRAAPRYGPWALRFAFGGIGFFFTLLFHGNLAGAVTSFLVCFVLRLLLEVLERLHVNTLFGNIVGGMLIGAVTALGLKLGLYEHYDKVIIGSIMTLVPGVLITNSIRDLIAGDSIGGMTRFTEALLSAICIAIGVAIPLTLLRYLGVL